jgi:predicted nucleotidyltransferase
MISLRSQITQKILNYFFLNPRAKKYTNELARLLDLDPKNLDRKLKELEKYGLLKSEFLGRQRYFYLNSRFPLIREYKKIILKNVGFEKELIAALEKLPQLKAAYLFGSYAKDKMDVASDIDILLVGDHSPLSAQKIILPFQQKLGREINIIDMTEKEFRSKKIKKDPFLKSILSAAIKII